MSVTLSRSQAAVAAWAVRDVLSRRQLDGRASWNTLNGLKDVLARLLDTSADGTETALVPAQLEDNEWMSANQVAEYLGCSTRWVRRIALDLDGEKYCRTWRFRRRMVVEYAIGFE